ncbi:MAG: hypothetical protein VX347_01510 [Bacteroidota bacterium]|nr:hypothetical protein [Bacteroidota bacterium]
MRAKFFLLHANVWVALCASSLCLSSSIVLNTYSFEIVFFVFNSTLFLYGFQRLIKTDYSKSHFRKQSVLKKWTLYILIIGSFFSAIYFCLGFQIKTLILAIIIGIISIIYPFYLRRIPKLKIYIISLAWAIITVLLLVIENNIPFGLSVLLEFSSRFLFVFAITIPFDIRDINYDSNKLKTIPQLAGVLRAKTISLSSLCLFLIINIWQYYNADIILPHLLGILFVSIISAILIYLSHPKKSNFFFGFWVEGLSILLFIALLLANQFRY